VNLKKSSTSHPHIVPTQKIRLDIFARKQFPDRSRSEIAEAIRFGAITLNGKVAKPSSLVRLGDQVDGTFLEKTTHPSLIANNTISLDILYENADFLIINKPAGIQAHPSDSETEHTIANAIVAHRPEIRGVGEHPTRPGIVHRLDKDTSGLLLIAKTPEAFLECKKMFVDRTIQKTYLAVVYGILPSDSGIIDIPIARSQSFRKQVAIKDGTKYKGNARNALTQYEKREIFSRKNHPYTLLTAHPHTGRMHQIRVHLSAIGHPIVGDTLYARKEFRRAPHTQRQLLHASKLTFSLLGKHYEFEAPLPKDFSDFLNQKTT
jgi:23S rRNA pseudouridine1911/1915/1917 synthase